MIVNDRRHGRYRLLRQIHGRGAFGEVHVDVDAARSRDEPQVVWQVDATDLSSAKPDQDAAETRAALEGAADAITALASLGIDTDGYTVYVTFVGINDADTEPSAVRAAATAAVVSAFDAADRFELTYNTDAWHYQAR